MAIESVSGTTINNSALNVKPNTKEANDVKLQTSSPVSGDVMDFTNIAQDIKTAVATGDNPPVVNEQRVAAVKLALQSGNYKVDAERVAEKMLQFENKLPNST